MKKTLMLLIFLCSNAFADSRDIINFEELKLKIVKETKRSRLLCGMKEYKNRKSSTERSEDSSYGNNISKKHKAKNRFKCLIKNIKKKIADKNIDVQLLENDDPNLLDISVTYKKGRFFNKGYKYVLSEASYAISSPENTTKNYELANIINESDRDLISINITELLAGNYQLDLKLIVKREFKTKRKSKKSFINKFSKPIKLSYSFDFEKVQTDTVFLTVEEVAKPDGIWQIGYDFTGSYSDGGEIVNYQFKVFLNNELNFEAQTSNNTTYISFMS